MKGKISEELETMLRDPQAWRQLRRILTSGQPGVVAVGGAKYKVSTVSAAPAGPGGTIAPTPGPKPALGN